MAFGQSDTQFWHSQRNQTNKGKWKKNSTNIERWLNDNWSMINIFFAHVTCFNMFQKSRNIEIIAIRTVFYLLSCYPFVKSSTILNDVASLKKSISFEVQVLKQQSMFLSSIKFEKDYLYWSLKKKCTFFVLKIPIQSIKATKYALFNNTFIAFQTFIVQNLSHILRSRSKWRIRLSILVVHMQLTSFMPFTSLKIASCTLIEYDET